MILKFYSNSCGPCKVLDKNLKTAGIEFTAIDVHDDVNADLVDKYKIRNIPTIIKIENGEEVKRNTGIMTPDKLKEWVNN